MNWDAGVKSAIDSIGNDLRSGVSAAVTAAVGAGIGSSVGPLGTVIGAGAGALAGLLINEITAAVRSMESDVFPPQETSFIVGTLEANNQRITTHTVQRRFTGHGGRYRLTLEWRLRGLPTRVERIALQAGNGQYVSAEGGGGRQLVATRPHIRSWETFGLIRLPGDRVALLAINGDYVAASGGGGRELVANRAELRGPSQFRLEDLGNGQVALRAPNGQYVTAVGGGGRELVANGSSRGRAETFRLHRL